MSPRLPLSDFEETYRAQAAFVAAVLTRLGVPAEAVGDAVQDVFVAAYRHWPSYDPERPIRAWLAGIARKVAFRYRRSQARRSRKAAALAALAADRADARTELDPVLDARSFLARFLEELPELHREVFVRADMQGFTAPEIAAQLDVGVDVVYGRLKVARRRLRKAVADDAERPGETAAAAAALVPPWALVLDRLQPIVGVGVTASPWLTGAAVKAFASTVAVGLVGLLSVAAVTAPSEPVPSTTREAPVVVTQTQPNDRPLPPHVPELAQAQETADVPPTTTVSVPTSVTTRTRATPKPAAPPPQPPDPLAEETRLVRSAQRALAAADPTRALELLAEHQRRFPEGKLADGRVRTRIRALCDLGRERQARGEAMVLAKRRPHDPLAQQSVAICVHSKRSG